MVSIWFKRKREQPWKSYAQVCATTWSALPWPQKSGVSVARVLRVSLMVVRRGSQPDRAVMK